MFDTIIIAVTTGVSGIIIGHYIGMREQKKISDAAHHLMVGLMNSNSRRDLDRIELDLSTQYMEEDLTKDIFPHKLLNYMDTTD
jgi:hypothetical protein